MSDETRTGVAGFPADLPIVEIMGASLVALTEDQCAAHIVADVKAGGGGWLITMNLDHLRRFVHLQDFTRLYRKATMAVADGMPLVWASRLQGESLPERVTGSNLIWSISELAADQGISVYLLGGDGGAAETSARRLHAAYPELNIAGWYAPKLSLEPDEKEYQQVVEIVVETQPDIVFVAFGSPKQDSLIVKLREALPGTWLIGVGITFSFVAGFIPRAPLWMQTLGLEWAHRLLHEPRRLAGRYLLHGIPFALTLFAHALRRRLTR